MTSFFQRLPFYGRREVRRLFRVVGIDRQLESMSSLLEWNAVSIQISLVLFGSVDPDVVYEFVVAPVYGSGWTRPLPDTASDISALLSSIVNIPGSSVCLPFAISNSSESSLSNSSPKHRVPQVRPRTLGAHLGFRTASDRHIDTRFATEPDRAQSIS